MDRPTGKERDAAGEKSEEECVGCKMIGSAAGVLGGSYVLFEEYKARQRRVIPHKPSIPVPSRAGRFMQLIGWSFIGLGIARAAS